MINYSTNSSDRSRSHVSPSKIYISHPTLSRRNIPHSPFSIPQLGFDVAKPLFSLRCLVRFFGDAQAAAQPLHLLTSIHRRILLSPSPQTILFLSSLGCHSELQIQSSNKAVNTNMAVNTTYRASVDDRSRFKVYALARLHILPLF